MELLEKMRRVDGPMTVLALRAFKVRNSTAARPAKTYEDYQVANERSCETDLRSTAVIRRKNYLTAA